jgi:hypothetical protein
MSIESAPQRLKELGVHTEDDLGGYCLPHTINLALPSGKDVPLRTYRLVKNAFDLREDGIVNIPVIYETVLYDVFGPQFEYDKDVSEIYDSGEETITRVFELVSQGHIVTVLRKTDEGLHAETLTSISQYSYEGQIDLIKGAGKKPGTDDFLPSAETFTLDSVNDFIFFYKESIVAFIVWPVVKSDEKAEV